MEQSGKPGAAPFTGNALEALMGNSAVTATYLCTGCGSTAVCPSEGDSEAEKKEEESLLAHHASGPLPLPLLFPDQSHASECCVHPFLAPALYLFLYHHYKARF